jgi:hypothetical protein
MWCALAATRAASTGCNAGWSRTRSSRRRKRRRSMRRVRAVVVVVGMVMMVLELRLGKVQCKQRISSVVWLIQ